MELIVGRLRRKAILPDEDGFEFALALFDFRIDDIERPGRTGKLTRRKQAREQRQSPQRLRLQRHHAL